MSNKVYKASQRDDRPLRTLWGHTDQIWTMAYLPDGERLVTGSGDKTVRIWTVGDGKQEGKSMVHAAGVEQLAVTSDGRRIISADSVGNITMWDVRTQKPVEGWKHTETYSRIAISADDRLLAYGRRTIIIQETNGRRTKQKIEVDGVGAPGGSSLCFCCDGSKLAIGRNDIFIYDVEGGRRILTLEGHESLVKSLQWSRDDTKLYSASDDCTIRCWNTETGQQIGRPWTGHTDFILSLSLSRDGTKLASASRDRTVRFWDTSQGHPIGHPLQRREPVLAVCISPSNDVVAAAGGYGKILFWRVPWQSNENQSTKPTSPPVPSISSDVTSTRTPERRNLPNPENALETCTDSLQGSYPSQPSDSARGLSFTGPSTTHQVAPPPVGSTLPHAPTSQRSLTAPLDLTQFIVKLEDRYSEGGAFGDVYRCHYNSPTGATEVAVKSFRFRFTLDEGDDVSHAVKMVRRELGIWRRLDHPNIVPFLGISTDFGMQGSLALVSAWMPNGSLQSFLGNHGEQLHVAHQLQFLWDTANGLDYLHSFPGSPIVHGDLNGNNVLVDASFTARLADFGYSTAVGNIPEALAYLQRSTTRPGAIRWSAPELILAEEDEAPERTPKSDIHSFGCLTLQVLSGKQPWSEVREEGAIPVRMFKGQKPKRPESRVMDDRHWEFIHRCWSSAEERPTAWMLASGLQEFLRSCPQSPSLRDMFSSSP